MTDHQTSSIEQRAILYSVRLPVDRRVFRLHLWDQVLEALEYSHDHGIVYGNLDPTHIMWFASDFSWKLVNLSRALPAGESTVQPNACRYTCPDITQSLREGHVTICARPSMDMWSFGIIAFEVLISKPRSVRSHSPPASLPIPGSHDVDADGIPEFVEGQLEQTSVDAERTVKRWLSANRRGRIEDAIDQQSLRIVRSLLQRDPGERRTATEVLEDVLFRTATDMYQRADRTDEVGACCSCGQTTSECHSF